MNKLLVVDDDQEVCQQLIWGLHRDYEVLVAADVGQAMACFRSERPRVVVLDLELPPHANGSAEGFQCLEQMLAVDPTVKVVILTGNSVRENAFKALQLGAFDFYVKPPVLRELRVIVSRAFHLADIEGENFRAIEDADEDYSEQWGLVGSCPAMQSVFSTIRKVAASRVPVLITGENGTGKELVANAIHAAGPRRKGPLVALNCGAIPENLLESELFGHEKGAFTGARFTVRGKLQYADRGTLFLDEIGELPVNLQVKLLRFLQDGTLQRVGGRTQIPVDTRTICATNVDVAKAIGEGRFREDLYYRIGVVTINMPPLRERGGDILLLAESFLERYAKNNGKKPLRFTPSALLFLKTYAWPGNVRELGNRVQRAAIMCDGTEVGPLDLGCDYEPVQTPMHGGGSFSLKEAREKMERELILCALDTQAGNVQKTAAELGVCIPTLYKMMKKYSIPRGTGDLLIPWDQAPGK